MYVASVPSTFFHRGPRPAPYQRYDFLDSLRGIAAISVLYLHSAEQLLHNNLAGNAVERLIMTTMTKFVDTGKVGVLVFFAISGFIIPFALAERNRSVIAFVINRICRLYPAYWLSIVLAVLVLYYLNGVSISTKLVAINFTMLQQFFLQPNVMDLYWTLQIELIFYTLCVVGFVAGILEDDRKLFVISAVMLGAATILAIIRYATHAKVPVAVPLALSIMFWGSILKHSRIDSRTGAETLALRIVGLYAMVIPVICALAYNFNAGFDETWYRYTLSYFSAIAAFYVLTGRLRIVGRVWSWLGRISYSIYLFHPIFIRLTLMYVVPLFPHSPVSHMYILAILAMTLAFCQITYSYVEVPGIAIGRALNRHLRLKRALAPQPQL